MKAILILPTYNERDNISQIIKQLLDVFKLIPGYKFNILVVDDDSPDGTADIVKKISDKNDQVSLLTGRKEGLGKAILRGMEHAVTKLKADIILQMDADLSHNPGSLPEFFQKFKNGSDFVIGSRYIPGGSIPDNWGLHRKIYSVLGNAFVRYGLGYPYIHDWTGGYRVYSKKYYELFGQKMTKYKGYVFQIAFLYNAVLSGAKIGEVPINFTDRRYGKSKIAPSEYIRDVINYVTTQRFQALKSSHFGKFLVVGTIGFIINTVILELFVRFRIHPSIGAVVGAECAIISNFYLNNHWTFRERKIRDRSVFSKFLQFNTTSVGAIIIQAGTILVGLHYFRLFNYRIWYIVGVLIGLVWNYLMYSRVIWKKS